MNQQEIIDRVYFTGDPHTLGEGVIQLETALRIPSNITIEGNKVSRNFRGKGVSTIKFRSKITGGYVSKDYALKHSDQVFREIHNNGTIEVMTQDL